MRAWITGVMLLGGVLLGACDGGGADPDTAVPWANTKTCDGEQCVCAAGETCDFSCAEGTESCLVSCEAGSTCSVDCNGAVGCAVACDEAASCAVDCDGAFSCGVTCPASECAVENCELDLSCTMTCADGDAPVFDVTALSCQ